MHILIITIDAMRFDHTSLAGYERDTTPFLRELAGRAAIFRRAISPSSWTYPSVISMMTGLYPGEHGGIYEREPRDFDKGELPNEPKEDIEWLPEVLEGYGYETWVGCAVPFAEIALSGRFQRGFSEDKAPAETLLSRYLNWLGMRGEDTFAYIHLADLHEPVQVEYPHFSLFGEIKKLPELQYWGFFRNALPNDWEFHQFMDSRVKLYDAAMAYVDDQLRSLFDSLRRAGYMGRDHLIVLTADHGEELWDHLEMDKRFFDPRPSYGISHGHHQWQELIHVPLLVLGDGIETGTYRMWRSTAAIAPTIQRTLGIQKGLSTRMRSLFEPPPCTVTAESTAYGYEKRATIKGWQKHYVSRGDNVRWLFDLQADPRERHPKAL